MTQSGPYDGSVAMHIMVDHSIIEVIVNNVTAITASVAASSAAAGGLALFGVSLSEAGTAEGEVSASVDVWTLADANNAEINT